jgi:hypothetical protein
MILAQVELYLNLRKAPEVYHLDPSLHSIGRHRLADGEAG